MYLMSALALGFAAWALPVVTMLSRKHRRFTAWSFALCSASLYLAIIDTQQLVIKGDWGAIEDTHGGILFGATVLAAVTVVLNVIALITARRKGKAL